MRSDSAALARLVAEGRFSLRETTMIEEAGALELTEDERADVKKNGGYSGGTRSPGGGRPRQGGVGTELHDVIESTTGIRPCPTCNDYAREMDRWGVAECIRRRDEIIEELLKRQNISKAMTGMTLEWRLKIKAAALVEKWGTARQVAMVTQKKRETIAGWLDTAIERAKAKEEAEAKEAKEKAAKRSAKSGSPVTDEWTRVSNGQVCPPGNFTIAYAITLAPRPTPVVQELLEQLRGEGVTPYVFAEPGSPEVDYGIVIERPSVIAARVFPDTETDAKFGAYRNYIQSLADIRQIEPDADVIVMLQDDVTLSPGLPEWLQENLWPSADCGMVSPYTPTRKGFTKDGLTGMLQMSRGTPQTAGPTMILKAEAVDAIINHDLTPAWKGKMNGPTVAGANMKHLDVFTGRVLDELSLSRWHVNPSLAKHNSLKGNSTLKHNLQKDEECRYANGVSCRNVFLGHEPAIRFNNNGETRHASEGELRIAIVGWNTASGLGYLNRDAAKHMKVSKWLIPKHQRFPELPAPESGCEIRRCGTPDFATKPPESLVDWLTDDIDLVLFFEHPYWRRLPETLQQRGVFTVLVPMYEWLPPDCREWVDGFDLLLCPTAQCFRFCTSTLSDERRVEYQGWPIDIDRLHYRKRERCERFLFIHGTGGFKDRKGGTIVAEAARLCPHVPLTVFTQTDSGMQSGNMQSVKWPAHVDVRHAVDDPTTLFAEGDVLLCPSRFEGLGLPLLEAQASGMPIVTTDGAPMNEYEPFATVRASTRQMSVRNTIKAYDACPQHLAEIMADTLGTSVSDASEQARRFAETRSWQQLSGPIADMLWRAYAMRPSSPESA